MPMPAPFDKVDKHRQNHGNAEDGDQQANHISDRAQIQHNLEAWRWMQSVSSRDLVHPSDHQTQNARQHCIE